MLIFIYNSLKTCLNISVNVCTRVVLILMSALIYQGFVIMEIFLNSFHLVYPPYLEKPITSMLNGFVRRFLRFLVSLLAVIIYPLTYILSIKRTRKCPPPTNPILFKSATTLTAMIRNKEITSEEVVTAYIDRCKEVNPYLNAIVEPRYESALREARAIDKMISSTTRTPEELAKEYPLLGVPFTVKESIAVEGMSNDAGTVHPYRNPAKADATIVRHARAAGGIPIAVTNTPQLCMNWETYNNVLGVTTNPYDQKRTPGGSSGGEAALISSAASLIGVGSDIAGSLRLPPMFTGIFGHKPTPRLVSVQGHVPDCKDDTFEDYFALGPITRYAEDLTLLLKIIKEPDGPYVPLDKFVDVSKLKYYYMEGEGSKVTNSIDSDVRKALQKAKDYMKNTYNIEVEHLKIKNMEHMWEISIRVLFNIKNIRNIYTDPENPEKLISMWPEVIKRIFGLTDNNFTSVAYGPLYKFFNALPRSDYEKLLKIFNEIKTEFHNALSDDGVLFFPTFPYAADLHYRTFYKFLNCSYLTIFNVLGLPVTACPIDFTRKGMPVGIQIVTNKCNDHISIAVAREFEKAFGGWVPPNKDLLVDVKTA
ncbi:unnamed protein product [Chilo suppressalis]|uniref:Amidase domain-containing protein n=1 Tax=Chilo suppressalis TaxID=168631 RepID=A0ABN8LCY4_CHISP|nr:unnamed protein product [Chilo suppressalis]